MIRTVTIKMNCLILLLLFAARALAFDYIDVTLGMSQDNPATSCQELYRRNPSRTRGTVGQYWIKTSEGLFEVTCNMKLKCGGVEGGWMQVIGIDMNRGDSCPNAWKEITNPRRLCLGDASGCASAYFGVKGIEYQYICGQARAYQKGSPDGFRNTQSIDDEYVEGISITLGLPRKHVWTYAVGLSDDYDHNGGNNCPCATYPGPPPPAFVGNHYYCESGDVGTASSSPFYLSDPLWDGTGCSTGNGCCASLGMPWFFRTLLMPYSEDFEARICKGSASSSEDIAIEKLELYVLSEYTFPTL